MNAELSERVKARLVQSGEEERIRELLKTRLVSCGWKDELKAEARKLIKERGRLIEMLFQAILDNVMKYRSSSSDTLLNSLLSIFIFSIQE